MPSFRAVSLYTSFRYDFRYYGLCTFQVDKLQGFLKLARSITTNPDKSIPPYLFLSML